MSGCILCGADSQSETTVSKVLEFLLALEEAIPAPGGRHHSFNAIEERLVLSICRGEMFQTCYLDENDLERPHTELIAEIEGLWQ